MAIIKMKRLHLLALRSDREELLHTLQRMGCVEISEPAEADGRSDAPPGDWEGLTAVLELRTPDGSALTQVQEEKQSAERALSVLSRCGAKGRGMLTPRPQLTEEELFEPAACAAGTRAVEAVLQKDREAALLQAEQGKLTAQKAALAPWLSLDLPLESGSTREMLVPNIFRSCLLEGCIEKGLCEEAGGPKYSQSLCITTAGVDAANSLYAVKHLVYDTQKLTMTQLKEALAVNFEGHEAIEKMCYEAPKHGNDIPDVDNLVRRFFRDVERIYRSHGPDYFGYEAHMDPFSLSFHNYFAPMTGALPNGRRKGVALTDASVSAMPGTDVNGSTALIKSAAQAIDTIRNNCNHMNMKFLPAALEGPAGTRMLLSLIKTYFDLGGGHVQFNCVSSETLRSAQAAPQNYKDLVVRVAGFSAYFTRLDKGVQNEIIKRTQYNEF